MLRRLITQMGLPAIAGLSLLLGGVRATASEQGWPILGRNWSYYGTSYPTALGSYGAAAYPAAVETYAPEYYAAYPYTYGGYTPEYYAAYPTWMPQTWGYYGSVSPENNNGSSANQGYYDTSTAASVTKRPVVINLRVPSDAKIWFDGSPTNQTGSIRSFESPPLAVGKDFVYQIRAQWTQNGKNINRTRRVHVEAGDVINLTMGSPAVSARTR